MEHILINCTPREVRVAIVVDGVLQDLFIERDCARGLVGNVYPVSYTHLTLPTIA